MASETLLYFPVNLHINGATGRVYAAMRPTPVLEKDGFIIAYVLTATVGSLHQGLYVLDGRCWRFVLPQPLLSEVLITSAAVDVYMGLISPITVATDAIVYRNGVRIHDLVLIGPSVFCAITPPASYVPPSPPPDPTLTAARNLSGHRVLKATEDGADYASSLELGDANRVIGLSTGAVMQGQPVLVQTDGEMTEPSWSWDISLPVFNGVDGLLTQVSASPGYSLIVGIPITPTTILVSVKQPIITI